MKAIKRLFFGAFCLMLCSCGPKIVIEETVGFENEVWAYGDSLSFEFSIQDTSKQYDLMVDIGHNARFPYQNLYSTISTIYPDAKRMDQILSFEMAEKTGRWYGKCKDETCKLTIPLQASVRFDQVGDYVIGFEQFSRKDSLWGFRDFTLRLTESIVK